MGFENHSWGEKKNPLVDEWLKAEEKLSNDEAPALIRLSAEPTANVENYLKENRAVLSDEAFDFLLTTVRVKESNAGSVIEAHARKAAEMRAGQ